MTDPAAPPPDRGRVPLVRDTDAGVLAGVCAGLANRLGIDPLLVRIGAVAITVATGGAAIAGYALAWFLMPAADGAPRPAVDALLARVPVGNWRVAAGVGFLTLSLLLVLREVGLWWSDALIWPAILAASGAALLWRQSRAMAPEPELAPAGAPGALRAGDAGDTAPSVRPAGAGLVDLYRGGFGVALVVGGALIALSGSGALDAASDALITALVVVVALALILAPFLWRLGRNLATERSERIRSQERAELAAHLHDSVLQTLALVQKRASDPRAVSQLARRQERELRSWLFESERADAQGSVAAALRRVAAEVEDAHGAVVEVIAVGDAQADERADALVAAAREAMVNAAKFAPDAGAIAVYAELAASPAQVFVRDRGDGFDPDAVPADRRGLRESIIGRMQRFGGTASVRSAPGSGTEVELAIDLGGQA
jgi:phage shock protein PspC (stress-responsive transcriptional regulator)/two-component sensor histidine kinase